jgi:hypothetical protein
MPEIFVIDGLVAESEDAGTPSGEAVSAKP